MAIAEEAAKSGGETESINIDKFSIILSKPDFLALPLTDPECKSVDAENGLWVKCSVCGSIINKKASPPRPSNVIPCRARRPFTLSRWIEHKAALGMDCPKCLHIHVPPTKSHISSVLKSFSVQNAVIYSKLRLFVYDYYF
jgi:hypothetical protein